MSSIETPNTHAMLLGDKYWAGALPFPPTASWLNNIRDEAVERRPDTSISKLIRDAYADLAESPDFFSTTTLGEGKELPTVLPARGSLLRLVIDSRTIHNDPDDERWHRYELEKEHVSNVARFNIRAHNLLGTIQRERSARWDYFNQDDNVLTSLRRFTVWGMPSKTRERVTCVPFSTVGVDKGNVEKTVETQALGVEETRFYLPRHKVDIPYLQEDIDTVTHRRLARAEIIVPHPTSY